MPGARAALVLLLTINLFNYIDRYVLSAAVPRIEEQLLPAGGEGNKAAMGSLAMAFMVSYMVLSLPFGLLADRIPRWRLVGIGVILWSLASGASGLAGTFAAEAWKGTTAAMLLGTFNFLYLTRCFVGVGEAAYGPVAPDMISDLYPVKMRGYVLSWFYAAIPVGSALGFVIGGQATQHLGWPWSFYLVVPPGLVLGVLCFFMPEPRKGATDLGETPARRAGFKDYLILLKTPSYVLDCLGMAAMTFALGGIAYWMPDYVHTFREAGELGTVSAIFGGIVVLAGLSGTIAGGLTGDWLRDRLPGSYFIVSGIAMLCGFPAFLAVLYTPFPVAWGFIFLACFCLFFNTGPTNTILANVTHPSMRATGYAVNIFVIHILGDAISPRIIGHITDTHDNNMNTGFLAVSFTILLGGILWLAGSFFLARDTALAPRRLNA